jgi:RimJ/RimL family protein N-acetyltransferase
MPGLRFREWKSGDAPALARFMVQPAYNRWLAVQMQSVAEVDLMVKRHLMRIKNNDRRHYRMCAEDISTGELVADGFIWLLGGGAAEVGWGVDPAVWNCGVGTTMAEVLCGMAIERLDTDEVWCKVMSPNLASAQIARKLDFSLQKSVMPGSTGLARAHDVDIYRLTAEEYFERGYDA